MSPNWIVRPYCGSFHPAASEYSDVHVVAAPKLPLPLLIAHQTPSDRRAHASAAPSPVTSASATESHFAGSPRTPSPKTPVVVRVDGVSDCGHQRCVERSWQSSARAAAPTSVSPPVPTHCASPMRSCPFVITNEFLPATAVQDMSCTRSVPAGVPMQTPFWVWIWPPAVIAQRWAVSVHAPSRSWAPAVSLSLTRQRSATPPIARVRAVTDWNVYWRWFQLA